MFTAAALAFFVGGRAINEFARTDRLLAEMEGIAFAAVCAALGAVLKSPGENLAEDEETDTTVDSLQK